MSIMITLTEIEYETEDQVKTYDRIKELLRLSNRVKTEELQDEKDVAFGSIISNGFIIKPAHPRGLGPGFSSIHANGKLGENNLIHVKFKLSTIGILGPLILLIMIYQVAIHFDQLDISGRIISIGVFGLFIFLSIRRTFKDLRKTESLVSRIIENKNAL